jgi:RNA polymerase sigma-70 factor (ECF subfamily)
MLRPLFAHGKPVVVTEFGMGTYRSADASGALGFRIMDNEPMAGHQLPLHIFKDFLAARGNVVLGVCLFGGEVCCRVAGWICVLVVGGMLSLSESSGMPLALVRGAGKTGGAVVAGEERGRGQLASLVVAAQGGDALAMDELIELLMPFVSRLCGSIALQEGADAAQETLLAVFRGLPSLRDPDALYGWVKRVAVREAVRVAERGRRAVPAELADLPARGDVELGADVGDVLSRLSPQHRAVLVLRDMYGHDEREVSQWLAVPPATVRTRLFRARRRFREEWQQ